MSQGITTSSRDHAAGATEVGLKVHSVVVCFHPDTAALNELCSNLVASGSAVIVVDNTEPSYLDDEVCPGTELVSLGRNTGIAHAQNVGIRRAVGLGADVIVLFDQDSVFDPDFLRRLTAPLTRDEPKVVAPASMDGPNGRGLPATRVTKLGLPAPVHCEQQIRPYPVDIVIASGTAATVSVFSLAGLMDEGFFIDAVDTEWCLRCRAAGIPIQVVPSAKMTHAIGSRPIRVAAWTVYAHRPTRVYYQVRNSFLLLRKAHVPVLFALSELGSVMINRLALLFFVQRKRAYLAAYVAGIRDGFKCVVGERPVS